MGKTSTSQTTMKWVPSVSFYFKVVFQKMNKPTFHASFLEISGLSWNMEKKIYRGNDGSFQAVPSGLTYTNLILRRPVGPLSGALTKWVKECHDFMFNVRKEKNMKAIPTYDVVIHLMDENSNPKVSWQCVKAYPMKWNLGTFDSGKSELAIETIELAYAYSERIK